MIKTILREPLLHFLIAGALLFGLYSFLGSGPEIDDRRIVVTQQQIQQLKDAWEKQWRRQPGADELEHLVEEFIQEEVLYREGLALGLDSDDTIIRRRMAQKVKFLVQDLVAPGEPDEVALDNFYTENADLFRKPARLAFTHVYFSTDRRGDKAEDDARQLLDGLTTGRVVNTSESGDAFMLQYDYKRVTYRDVAQQFGPVFAETIFELEPGAWQGPVRSSYGIHLVRVAERVEETLPSFIEVREQVREAYIDDRRRKANDEAIRRMKDRYQIVVEDAAPNKDTVSHTVVDKTRDGAS
jgi:hypothetical protein